jgi:hypothetical protein
MNFLRKFAIFGALMLMLGEAYRSWGAGRPIPYWMDDMLAGAMMIWAALLVRDPTPLRRAFFSASWGVSVGMLYGSFFGKLYEPATSTPGNFSIGLLTALVGIAFFLSIAGLIASIILPDRKASL